jgi:hypothetical protein
LDAGRRATSIASVRSACSVRRTTGPGSIADDGPGKTATAAASAAAETNTILFGIVSSALSRFRLAVALKPSSSRGKRRQGKSNQDTTGRRAARRRDGL